MPKKILQCIICWKKDQLVNPSCAFSSISKFQKQATVLQGNLISFHNYIDKAPEGLLNSFKIISVWLTYKFI